MTDGGPDQANKKSTGETLSDMDSILVEEFCTLVAEIAARALTRRQGGSHNEKRDNRSSAQPATARTEISQE